MKRYFTFETPPVIGTWQPRGMYHYLSLPRSGYIAVVEETGSAVPADWTELPHLLEQTAANFNGINTAPGAFTPAAGERTPPSIAGVSNTDTTFQIAKKLAVVNRLFHP